MLKLEMIRGEVGRNEEQKITSFILHIILISTFNKVNKHKEHQPLESRKGENQKKNQSKYLPTLTPCTPNAAHFSASNRITYENEEIKLET